VSGCWSGEDCSAADNDPRDFNGHGTHCAGNVGAINNNGYAVSSASGGWGNGTLQPTASGVKVMCLRIGWAAKYGGTQVGYVRMDFAASAFYYAAKNGAKIISCSWGSSNSGGLSSAITYFVGKGGLVFKAAGNSGTQSADYMCGRGDVIAVAATDKFDKKASFSNYGTWVDLSAPGVSIHSTFHKYSNPSADYTASLSGTSMATPLAASVAASVWSKNPTWIAAQVWARVRDTADNIYPLNPAYVGKLGSGRVNLYNAVK
jgi:subtilisin family serine protease